MATPRLFLFLALVVVVSADCCKDTPRPKRAADASDTPSSPSRPESTTHRKSQSIYKKSKGNKSRSKNGKIKIEHGCKEVNLLSRVNRPVYRTIEGGYVKSIKLIEEHHDSLGCTYDHTYGCKDGHEIFAKKGCRGRFKVCVS